LVFEEAKGLSVERLRFSSVEAAWIAGFVSSSSTLMETGFSASRDTVLSGAMGDYRILHLAAHALLDDDHPEVSGIALSLFDETGRAQDGFLRLHEIHERLTLRSDLVVVSACETALGRDVPGEGLMGLARAFFAAGAARVVASVYSVSDAATAQLMREFYRGMFGPDRLSAAAALRAAQLRMREQRRWRHPFYWSGFVLLGEPG
jgi:CHAT domain-containing protein